MTMSRYPLLVLVGVPLLVVAGLEDGLVGVLAVLLVLLVVGLVALSVQSGRRS